VWCRTRRSEMVLDDWVAASCCQAVTTALHLEAMRPTTVVAQRLSSALLLLQHPLLRLLLQPSFDPWVIFSISWRRRRSWWVAAAVVEVLPCL
jgi:hypothetical protein